MNNFIGQSLGRYHITEKLGEGGMATVYKAYDTRLEREVAVKIIRSGLFGNDVIDRILKRFEREAKAMAKLSHANIVKVLDYGEHEGSPYLVMELLTGGTLKTLLGNPLPWQQAVQYLRPIAEALAYAHSKGILHRDVKPSNILITENNEPVLTDFGIAKLLDGDDGNTLTGTGVGVGTPEYMAPEQGLGKEVDGRADVYALGIVLYELVTGRKPYTADTPLAVLLKQVNDPLPAPGSYAADLPDIVERVIFKALAKAPEDRYQDMKEFALGLKKLEGEEHSTNSHQKLQLTSLHADHDTFMTVDHLDSEKIKTTHSPVETKPARAKPKTQPIIKTLLLLASGIGLIGVIFLIIWVFDGLKPKADPIATLIITESPVATETPLEVGSTMVSPKDGMTLVYVPAGELLMGSAEGVGAEDEHPQHTLSITDYWIDKTEVTNGMYEMCVENNSCSIPKKRSSSTVKGNYFGNPEYDNYPVINITWEQAKTYCEWAGRQLPTEAQWEKAARGTDGRKFPWGDEWASKYITNYSENENDTTDVNNFPGGASPYGALNMAGNVWEWVGDWYDEKYYDLNVKNNPKGPTAGIYKVLRGGSYNNSSSYIRTTIRRKELPTSFSDNYGFRCSIIQ